MNPEALHIEPFTPDDIPAAVELTIAAWNDALATWDKEVARIVCEYSVRYEYQDPSLALKITDGTGMKGFIFASSATSGNAVADEWYSLSGEKINDDAQRDILNMLLSSSHSNEEMVLREMGDNDVMLTFFLSSEKGCGKRLLAAMNELLKSRNYNNMFLWTDITCNHGYYPRNGFELVSEKSFDKYDTDFVVYVYRKEIK
ncbi:MAG: hypothetical protein IJZ22_03260 [Bacteroidaceae bacterium]|nr:hypothetical protein [Bacteroidaceae bacterium]